MRVSAAVAIISLESIYHFGPVRLCSARCKSENMVREKRRKIRYFRRVRRFGADGGMLNVKGAVLPFEENEITFSIGVGDTWSVAYQRRRARVHAPWTYFFKIQCKQIE